MSTRTTVLASRPPRHPAARAGIPPRRPACPGWFARRGLAGSIGLLVVATSAGAAAEPRVFVELGGFRGAGMGTNSTFQQDDRRLSVETADPDAYVQRYGYRTPRAWGLAVAGGVFVRPGLAVVGSFQAFTYRTRRIHVRADDGAGADRSTTIDERIHSDLVAIGARSSHGSGRHQLYLGAGLAVMPPYAMETVERVEGEGTYTTRRNVGLSILGGYGEIGYRVRAHRGLYVAIGARAHAVQARRDGRTTDLEFAPEGGGAVERASTEHRAAFAARDIEDQAVGARTVPSIDRPYSQIFADIRLELAVGYAL